MTDFSSWINDDMYFGAVQLTPKAKIVGWFFNSKAAFFMGVPSLSYCPSLHENEIHDGVLMVFRMVDKT